MTFDLILPSLGIDEIDRQHKSLLQCLDQLEYWVGRGSGYPAALNALTTLHDYMAMHFGYEEEFLRSHGYPSLAEHIQEHQRLTAELARIEARVLAGEDVSSELIATLREWIVTHIGIEDVEYAEFFGTRDVAPGP